MIKKIDLAHMEVAEIYSRLSKAKRLKVGAIIVKDNRVISIGYNGTPAGWDNNCEEEIEGTLKTKAEVIHAESNAIAKLARSYETGLDSDMYITHAPCFDCAKLIFVAGIKKVFFRQHYRTNEGINFLEKCNIEVIKI